MDAARTRRSRTLSPDATRWGAFPNTVLHLATDPPLRLDLREPVGPDLRGRLWDVFPERTFGVITASNPMGRVLSPGENATRDARLWADVAGRGVRAITVEACSPDGTHCEHSIALALAMQPLVALGCQYDQLAVFWFDGEAFSIVPARATLAALRLPA